MAHIMEKSTFNSCLYYGLKIGVYSGNVWKLTEDLKILKPTIFISVPWLFNKIHYKI